MKRSGSGRTARKIGAYDEDSTEGSNASNIMDQASNSDPVVKRPTFAKTKKRPSQRISFGPAGNDGEESSDSAVFTPKRSTLSRLAIEKNAERRAKSPFVAGTIRTTELGEDRPSYDKKYIAELRNSTPSTPRDLNTVSDEETESMTIDVASKFGPPSSYSTRPTNLSAIPTEAEIQEKKARRARLASEHAARDDDDAVDNPWASDDNDDFRSGRNEISLRPKEKYAETRLVQEDEDIAEGFDDYVEDGRISLGRKAERAAQKRRRAEMAELIDTAEGASDDDGTDDSEAERIAAYEEAQTRAGAYGKNVRRPDNGVRTPPKTTPLPDLEGVLERLQLEVSHKEQRREMLLNRIGELRVEKSQSVQRQQFLQEELQKTGESFEKLRLEAGMPAIPANSVDGTRLIADRGLESLGTTPLENTPVVIRSEED